MNPALIAETHKLTPAQRARIRARQPKRWAEICQAVAEQLRWDSQHNQLVYYKPVNDEARKLHLSTAREVGIQGGNRSGKSGTMIAEMAIQMTGIVPLGLKDVYPAAKLRPGPIRARLVVSSLVNAWDTNLKLKLQWWEWSGRPNENALVGAPSRGHWGLIPQRFLANGDWAASWSERHRILKLTNGSTLQVMSWEQAIEDFNQGSFHFIGEDEIPTEDIHRANKLRVMDVGGQVVTGGTPPDDRSAGVTAAWFFDQILTPGLEGTNRDEVDAIQLWTENNRTLRQEDVEYVAKGLTEEQKRARLHGEAIHLSGLVLKGFTERPKTWCFHCDAAVRLTPGGRTCGTCGSTDTSSYRHVWDDGDLGWPGPTQWPVLFYMDPHQSKPTACAWYKVDPQDAWWQIAEAEIVGDATVVRDRVLAIEREHGWHVAWRKGDPKITAQTNQFAREFEGRVFSIREAFEEVGFPFDGANTNFSVAVERIEQAFRPNRYTRAPRLRIHRDCTRTIYQVGRYVWNEGARRVNVNKAEQPSRAHSDFPALLRYLAMDEPTFRGLEMWAHQEPIALASGAGRGVGGW